MRRILLFMSISALAGGTFSSCKTEGCTEPNAINYDPTADKNDGSCYYSNSSNTNNTNNNNSNECSATVTFDNYDNNDYTIYSNYSGDDYYIAEYGEKSITLTSDNCYDYDIYDGGVSGTLMGYYTFCPCDGDKTVTIDF